ncbi:hypothetical protein XENOCAPTIV_001070 [Xenoophorus captivus]|uniref:Uncharacterized protein n=1 Tax=Xenoophorus captivus TaxID=1517983 RepID=A0ABV0RWJ9_9TELE
MLALEELQRSKAQEWVVRTHAKVTGNTWKKVPRSDGAKTEKSGPIRGKKLALHISLTSSSSVTLWWQHHAGGLLFCSCDTYVGHSLMHDFIILPLHHSDTSCWSHRLQITFIHVLSCPRMKLRKSFNGKNDCKAPRG